MKMNKDLKDQVNWLIEQIKEEMKVNPKAETNSEAMVTLISLSKENSAVEAYLLPMEYSWIDYILMSY